jgi:hypothetical protein
VCARLLCVTPGWVCSGPQPRRDSAGKAACERCGRRLAKCAGQTYSCGAGSICQACYNANRARASKRAISLAGAAVPPPAQRIKGSLSDPGQPQPQPVTTQTRQRVRAPKPTTVDRKKKKEERQAEIATLLDAAHARRVAALAAESAFSLSAASLTTINDSSVVWS